MKQSYHLAPSEDPPDERDDDSFKLCVCTLLLLASLFGIISLFMLTNSILSAKYTQGSRSDNAALQIFANASKIATTPDNDIKTIIKATSGVTKTNNMPKSSTVALNGTGITLLTHNYPNPPDFPLSTTPYKPTAGATHFNPTSLSEGTPYNLASLSEGTTHYNPTSLSESKTPDNPTFPSSDIPPINGIYMPTNTSPYNPTSLSTNTIPENPITLRTHFILHSPTYLPTIDKASSLPTIYSPDDSTSLPKNAIDDNPTTLPTNTTPNIPTTLPANTTDYNATSLPTFLNSDKPTTLSTNTTPNNPTTLPTNTTPNIPTTLPTNTTHYNPTTLPTFLNSDKPTTLPTNTTPNNPTILSTNTTPNIPTTLPANTTPNNQTTLPTNTIPNIPTTLPANTTPNIPTTLPTNTTLYNPTSLPTFPNSDKPTTLFTNTTFGNPTTLPTNTSAGNPSTLSTDTNPYNPTTLPKILIPENPISLSRNNTYNSSSYPTPCSICTPLNCPVCNLSCPTTSTTAFTTTTKSMPAIECRTQQCYSLGSRVLSLLNPTLDPCHDFYSYACGGLLDTSTVVEQDFSDDVFNRMRVAVKSVSASSPTSYMKLKNFYDGCLNYDKFVLEDDRKKQGREVILNISQFWTIRSQNGFDLTTLLKDLFYHGSASLFDIKFDVHAVESSKFQVVISPPNLLKFSFSSHFVSDEEHKQRCQPQNIGLEELEGVYEAYKHCMNNFSVFIEETVEALHYFEAFKSFTEEDTSQLLSEIRTTLEVILGALKDSLNPQMTQQDIQNKNFKTVSIRELEGAMPMVQWSALFSGAIEDDEDVPSLLVQVYSMDVINAVFDKLTKASSQRSIYNSLLAIFCHDLFDSIVTTRHMQDRGHYCLRVASSLMPHIATNLYLRTFPSDTNTRLHNQTHEVFEQLRVVMDNKLSASEWLDNKTLETLKEKLKSMSLQLPITFDEVVLNTTLERCPLNTKNYLRDAVCLMQSTQQQLYQHISFDPHSKDVLWSHFLTAFSTKPIFIYNLNMLMVPLAVLVPLYEHTTPIHVVMARLGNLLARGIGHNFDSTGVKFSANGRIGTILSEASNPSYVTALEDGNIRYDYPKHHVEGETVYTYTLSDFTKLSQDERLSDLTAADLALSAVSQHDSSLPWVPTSHPQVYFLVLAQSFCTKMSVEQTFTHLYEGTSLPPFERVNTLVSNLESFSEAFKCPIGSNMNNAVKPSPFPMLKKDDML